MAGTPTDCLMERGAELDALRAGLRDRAGTFLLAIEGVPGIGKTRLLEAMAAAARSGGARVLMARAGELERELPFGVMRQLLEPVLATAAPADRAAFLSGSAALALPALQAHPDEPAAGSFAVLHGLYWLTVNVAAAVPLVLCVDDLQWADEPSLRALAYLVARLDGADAQLGVALRPHEPGTDTALVEAVTGTPHGRVVRPSPLSRDATAVLVRERLGEAAADEFCAACHAATGGNPLLLSELTRDLADEGIEPTAATASRVATTVPGALASRVLRRLARLSPHARSVAHALAILGDGADAPLIAMLARLEPAPTNAILEAMARAEILVRAQPATFSHPLVRAAVAADVLSEDRGRLHRQAACLLAADGAGTERLAPHLLEVTPAGDEWVVSTLRAAAAETAARGAPEVAGRLLRRALAEPPATAEQEAAVLLAAGLAESQAGDPRAVTHLRRAVEVAPDPVARAHAVLALAPVLGVAGELEAGVDLVLAALDDLDGEGDGELRLRLEAELVNLSRLDVRLRPFGLRRLERLEGVELGRGPAASMLLANLATEALARGESIEEALDLSSRALAGGLLLTSPIMYALAANALTIAGHCSHGLSAWNDFIVHARARGDIPAVAWGHAFRACVHWRTGTLTNAIADAEVALNAGPAHGFDLAAGFAFAFLVEALVLRGELTQARTALARAPGTGEQLQDTLLLGARGRLRLAEGRTREAVEDFQAVGRLLEAWRVPNEAMAPWRADAALALSALGDGEQAHRLAAAALETARRWGDPWLVGQALRALALVGPTAERQALLKQAETLQRPSEARLELGRTLAQLGAAHRAAGDHAAARETLREALDIATYSGAPAIARSVRDELIRAGGRPRRSARRGVAALTPTEERVARLAAAGPTNREIAQALFVTEKTVEAHLASAYRKLGIRSRRQLPGAL